MPTSSPGPSGRTVYGVELGVIMLDTQFPRPLGDVGNARTWPFPVVYEVVDGAHPARVVGATDPDLLTPFIRAAEKLEAAGVHVITTSCGFLSCFQPQLAAAVAIPVVSSALLQVPTAAAAAGPNHRVAILTERANTLSEQHFAGAGWSSDTIGVHVQTLRSDAVFPTIYSPGLDDREVPTSDHAALEQELVDAAQDALAAEPRTGAFVMECVNFVPYGDAIRRATGLPVYDLRTAVLHAHAAVNGGSQ